MTDWPQTASPASAARPGHESAASADWANILELAKKDLPQTASPASAARPAHESEYTSCSMSERCIPIFEVAFRGGTWWSIPSETSKRIYDEYKKKQNAVYIWDWGDSRVGSWQLNGEETSISRYMIDFDVWEQRDLDNHRRRSVRLVWVTAEMVRPKWTGKQP